MTDLFTTPDHGPNGQIKRDQHGRYLLPDPNTGEEKSWTRVTTLAGTLADRYGLEQWTQRNIVYGLGQRQDLYAQAAAATLDDKQTLGRIVKDAQAAAADKAGANLGSAIHQFTERIDRGEPVTVPAPYNQDIDAYTATLDSHDVAVCTGWVERVVIIPELEVVGTLDRLVDGPWGGTPRVADLKTGKDVARYGMTEIALQLALYAHGTHWWDGHHWQPMIPVDQDHAVVMHLPVGRGHCTLYQVDIDAGWDAVQLAADVRRWRRRKNLAQQMSPVAPAAQPDLEPVDRMSKARVEWVRARVQRLIDHGHGTLLARQWSQHADVPTFKQGGPTTEHHIDLIAEMCAKVEADIQAAFGPTDPAPKQKEPTA
jgi:hypothetical protein